eukprot:Rhum_TRINITY_DN20704_c0_g1::Rhum_TRINITY_DN20704_c0_g1_i1::g.171921::m.171921
MAGAPATTLLVPLLNDFGSLSDAERKDVIAELNANGWTDLHDLEPGTPEIEDFKLKPGVKARVKHYLCGIQETLVPPSVTTTVSVVGANTLVQLVSSFADISDDDMNAVIKELTDNGFHNLRDLEEDTPEIDTLALKPGVKKALKRQLKEAAMADTKTTSKAVRSPFGQAFSGVAGKTSGTAAIMKAAFYYAKEDVWAWPIFALGVVVLALEAAHTAVLIRATKDRPYQLTRCYLHIAASMCILIMSVFAGYVFNSVTPSAPSPPTLPVPLP